MSTTLTAMAKLIGTPLLGAGLVLGGALVTAGPAAASTSSVVGSDLRPPAPDAPGLQRIDDREPGYYPTSPAPDALGGKQSQHQSGAGHSSRWPDRDPGYYPTSPAHQSDGSGSESHKPGSRGSARH